MELETLDYAWRTKDDAQIHFSRKDTPWGEVKDDPPTTLTAAHVGSCCVHPPTREIPLEELELIVATHCEARGGSTKWNSNTIAGAYRWNRPHTRPGLVLYEVNGTGNHFIFLDQLEMFTSFMRIVESGVHQIVLWDLICSWFRVYGDASRDAAGATEDRYRQAFVDGRLKKRKNRGQATYKVWIEEPKAA
jgi:hypothetical protein